MPNAEARLAMYSKLVQVEEGYVSPESATINALHELFRASHPQESFGEVSISAADINNIVTPFEAALEDGYLQGDQSTGDDFLLERAKQGLKHVYVVLAPLGSELAGLGKGKPWLHHQPELLESHEAKLRRFEQALDTDFSSVDPAFRDVYRASIHNKLSFCDNARQLGNPAYTTGQRSPEQWGNLIDAQKSRAAQEIVLRHEAAAIAILETGEVAPQLPNKLPKTINEAFDYWRFTPNERNLVIGDEPLDVDLSPGQGSRFFEVMIRRLKLDWKIEFKEGSKAINVEAKVSRIEYPPTRSLSPFEMAIFPGHEIGVHCISGVNGSLQPCPLLGSGMPDYLSTQEGLATISELIAGEPFGHERQRLFAARYLAAAMALKTVENDGIITPKYTVQQIYNQLRDYRVSPKDAGQTVWRFVRGTSLQRKITKITPEGMAPQMVAETFVKDVVYFEGYLNILQFMMDTLPVQDTEINDQGKISIHGHQPQDFSVQLLARIGRQLSAGKPSDDVTFQAMRETYNHYVGLGRDALVNVLQYFLVGKMRFEDMLPGSPWINKLKRTGLIQYKDLFNPSE